MHRVKFRYFILGLVSLCFVGCEADRQNNFGHRRRHLFFRTNRAMFSPLDTLNVPQGLVDDLRSIQYKKLNFKYFTAKTWQSRMANTPLIEQRAKFRMRPGSTFELSIRDEEEISGRYVVGPDGAIHVSLVKSPIHLEGKTYEEAREAIGEELKAYIKNPEITLNAVLIKKDDSDTFKGGRIIMAGSIGTGATNGAVPVSHVNLEGNDRLWDIIASVGGIGPGADMQHIVVMRKINEELNIIICDFQRLSQFGDLGQNIRILDEDIVYIPMRENSFGEQFLYEWNIILGYLAGLITWDFAIDQFKEHDFLFY